MDIVEYDGGTENQEIPHSLGSKPGMMIIKDTSGASTWIVYHQSLGATKYIALNNNADFSTSGNLAWNNTEPTSSVFTVGSTSWDGTNQTGSNYIAYLFADTAGLIKCDGYTGNSATNFIDCGFDAGWVLIRNSNGGDWAMYEVKRGDGNLNAHEANAEVSRPGVISFGSGGFTLLNNNAHVNQSGDDFIYVAIAEGAAFLDTTELTCATDTGLADIDAVGGEVYMTDGSIELDGSYTKSEYTPTTSNIASVTETAPSEAALVPSLPSGIDFRSATDGNGNWLMIKNVGSSSFEWSNNNLASVNTVGSSS